MSTFQDYLNSLFFSPSRLAHGGTNPTFFAPGTPQNPIVPPVTPPSNYVPQPTLPNQPSNRTVPVQPRRQAATPRTKPKTTQNRSSGSVAGTSPRPASEGQQVYRGYSLPSMTLASGSYSFPKGYVYGRADVMKNVKEKNIQESRAYRGAVGQPAKPQPKPHSSGKSGSQRYQEYYRSLYNPQTGKKYPGL